MENRQVPSDANGVYSLPSGYEAVTGEVIQASQHNPPLEDLASSMSARLMRSGVAPMTGAFKVVDGSVGSPGLTFNTDTTSGIYKTANGIGVSVGGSKVAEFTSTGVSRMIGELLPWTLLSAPSGWVLPYGQTLSRTTYADLWTIAQTQIAAGNTFYNNGNGTTTFGIADLRGRVIAGNDAMGGSAASRLTLTYLGSSAAVVGAVGGSQSNTLTVATVPALTFSGTTDAMNNNAVHSHGLSGGSTVGTAASGASGGGTFISVITPATLSINNANIDHAHSFSGTTSGGGGAHANVQPTVITNYILYAGA